MSKTKQSDDAILAWVATKLTQNGHPMSDKGIPGGSFADGSLVGVLANAAKPGCATFKRPKFKTPHFILGSVTDLLNQIGHKQGIIAGDQKTTLELIRRICFEHGSLARLIQVWCDC
jgi:hypothetical protein